MRYEDSIRQIKGVGEKAEQRFHKLDIWNVGDLLEHYPREYDEFHDLVKIADVKEGEMAAVEGVPSFDSYDRKDENLIHGTRR